MFKTSLTATACRLVESVRRPALVACVAAGRVQWCKRGSLLPERLWLLEYPGQRSHLATLERLAGASRGGVVAADVWTEGKDADEYELREDSVMITDQVSLTILSWPDESQILALADEGESGDDE